MHLLGAIPAVTIVLAWNPFSNTQLFHALRYFFLNVSCIVHCSTSITCAGLQRLDCSTQRDKAGIESEKMPMKRTWFPRVLRGHRCGGGGADPLPCGGRPAPPAWIATVPRPLPELPADFRLTALMICGYWNCCQANS